MVEDLGVGIELEDLLRVFEFFVLMFLKLMVGEEKVGFGFFSVCVIFVELGGEFEFIFEGEGMGIIVKVCFFVDWRSEGF